MLISPFHALMHPGVAEPCSKWQSAVEDMFDWYARNHRVEGVGKGPGLMLFQPHNPTCDKTSTIATHMDSGVKDLHWN